MNPFPYIIWNINILLESLPISSSGHIQLLLKRFSQGGSYSVDGATELLMHIPNALVIGSFLIQKGTKYLALYSPTDTIFLIISLGIANTITGSAYLLLKNRNLLPLPLGFFISGSVLLSLWYVPLGTILTLSPLHAVLIGCAQTAALLPGVSRMALTTVCALWLGITAEVGFLFSLACELALILVGIGTSILSSSSFRAKLNSIRLPDRLQLAGLMISSLAAFGALHLVLNSLTTGTILFFGWYLVLLSIITGIFIF